MEITFRSVEFELGQPNYFKDEDSLRRIVAASGVDPEKSNIPIRNVPETIVACANGCDVGFSIWGYSPRRKWKRVGIFVDSDYQRLGIGSALFTKTYDVIGEYGLIVSVRESKTQARRFFEKRNFLPVYISYWVAIDFRQIKYRILTWLSKNEVERDIIIEYVSGNVSSVNQECEKVIEKHNHLISSNFGTNLEMLKEQGLLEGKFIFDCNEVYTAREKGKIIGIAVFSTLDANYPALDFLYVEANDKKHDFIVRMLLIKQFAFSEKRDHPSRLEISANSIDLTSLILPSHLNDGLPHGSLVYARAFSDSVPIDFEPTLVL